MVYKVKEMENNIENLFIEDNKNVKLTGYEQQRYTNSMVGTFKVFGNNVLEILWSYDSIVALKYNGYTFKNKKFKGYSSSTSNHISIFSGILGNYIRNQLFKQLLKTLLKEDIMNIKNQDKLYLDILNNSLDFQLGYNEKEAIDVLVIVVGLKCENVLCMLNNLLCTDKHYKVEDLSNKIKKYRFSNRILQLNTKNESKKLIINNEFYIFENKQYKILSKKLKELLLLDQVEKIEIY